MALNVGELFATISLEDRLSAGLRKAMDVLRDAAKKFGDHAGSITKQAGSLGLQFTAAALKASALAGGLAAAGQAAIGLVAALAPAAGIIAAYPAAMLLFAGAATTLKLALDGVSDAMQAALGDDAKKFEESLQGLSPAAQAVVREVREFKPAFDGLKSAVQEALFAPLIGQARELAGVLLGPLRDGMTATASRFGELAAGLSRIAQQPATVALLRDAFALLSQSIGTATPGLLKLAEAGRNFVAAVLPGLSGIGSGIGGLATRFADFLNKAAESGRALEWVRGALEVFRQLGQVAGNLIGIVKGVFSAMQSSGAGALGVVGQLLAKFNAYVNSAKGQQILVTIFQSLQRVGQAVFPIFEALGGAVAKIAPQIANIATALGPGLAAAVSALGPALAALGPGLTAVAENLSKAFASPELQAGLLALGQGLSSVLAAVAPMLPLVAQLAGILGQILGAALQNVSSNLGPLIAALSDALQPALGAISSAIEQLAPLMTTVADAFGQLLGALAQELLPPLLQLVPTMLDGLVPAFVDLFGAVSPLLPILTDLAVRFIKDTLPAILPIIPALNKLTEWFVRANVKIADFVAAVIPHIEKVVSIFQWMYNRLVGNSIIPDMVSGVGRWLGTTLTGYFRDLPGKITSAVSNLPSVVGDIGKNIVSGIWSGIQSKAAEFTNNVRNLFGDIVKNVKNSLGIKSPSKVFATIGRFMMQGLAVGVDRTAGLVGSSLRKVATLAAKTAMPDLSMPGVTVPDGIGGGRALSRTVVNVTNHYPQAEPTSVSINRGLQYVGAMGVI